MTEAPAPTYRYRGHVKPSAEVARPAKAYRNAATDTAGPAAPTSATLDIFDVIDSFGGWWGISARDVDAALAIVGDVDTLYVRVNSPGGEATEGVAIANLLRAHKADVRVTVYGIAASAASVIAIAGDVVNMAPGSLLMVHEASGIEFGTAADMRAEAAALDAISDGYASLYALKTGGPADTWRATMRENGWYTPEAAVAAKLADRVGLDPTLPDSLPPVEDDTDEADDATVIEIDIEISPAARAATRRFDLSMLPNAPAALAATQTPAIPPVAPSTEPKEADTMSDTLLAGLRKQLGLADDADEATVLAANAEALTEAADPPAATASTDVKSVVAALEADGKVVVSRNVLDELTAQAQAGAQARAKQLEEERDATIAKAFSDGKISADRRDAWKASWDKDAEGTKADLESLPARFPVAKGSTGYLGHDGSVGDGAAFSDDEAAQLGQLAGVSAKGLLA